ncbi:hypothetical protein NPIL_644191 [Nephila pilipes]|uniref:Uncharacterized protein n=1 Tax=Nephila pilipes TaxID=299642 RepID=A0A8X6UAH3_NEPPI|nr:hypothetical protein NPIL_644191 [Nephila pilipes]
MKQGQEKKQTAHFRFRTHLSTSSSVKQEVIVRPYSVANKLDVPKLHQKSLREFLLSLASLKEAEATEEIFVTSSTVASIVKRMGSKIILYHDVQSWEKVKRSNLAQFKKRFDNTLQGTRIKKLVSEVREEGESIHSDGGQLSPAPSSS